MSPEQNIRVEVEFVGAIRRPWPEQKRRLEAPTGTTVGQLLASLGYEEHELRYLVIQINGAKSKKASVLRQDDRLMVMLIIGGG